MTKNVRRETGISPNLQSYAIVGRPTEAVLTQVKEVRL
jgi:hypothetical protein